MATPQEKMIATAQGFQYSVSIAYDLKDETKLKNFIPTRSSLLLLEDILLSTQKDSSSRARILIGAYGKGKSHIVLTILALLAQAEPSCFTKLNQKLSEHPKLEQLVQNYRNSKTKLLPVIISGSNISLTQAFILSLQRTLNLYNMLDVMPETNYKAAVRAIEKWQQEFPQTYHNFQEHVGQPVQDFITALQDYDIATYREFEQIYPMLTSGSSFNPFLGFDVVELYENVAKEIKKYGYEGLYVVYDEFSKYLEANITQASVSDTKMLQDFAEKCNRSGSTQLHLMLISHKEIANYIDKLPKQKVDGWRGISERFQHVLLNNNFSQTYEIIHAVIEKQQEKWASFTQKHQLQFDNLIDLYKGHSIFSDMEQESVASNIYSCYPLHPVSTFILPRLSERIAQNERTLFTFLSATGTATLPNFLTTHNENDFNLVTPDLIYDYFEPLFKKEIYWDTLHSNYILTSRILDKLSESDILERKIVKTISLIYTLEQFEKLPPTQKEIADIFTHSYSSEEISQALNKLIDTELVIYLRKSNSYLKLKETAGIDIKALIEQTIEKQRNTLSTKTVLNQHNNHRYLYPSRFNDEKAMTRYFSFQFINSSEITENINWTIKSEGIQADGIIYAILPNSSEELPLLQQLIKQTTTTEQRMLFILPKTYTQIEEDILEFTAVDLLMEKSKEDRILYDEYEIIHDDLREIINNFISTFTLPEQRKAQYFYKGEIQEISRKVQLSEKLSFICETVFPKTPIINNESINKNDITGMAYNSRNKLLQALLRNQLEKDLGLSGSGQDVSIMRSTLQRTGIWDNDNLVLSLKAQKELTLQPLLETIQDFILSARNNEKKCFAILYDKLISPQYGIGARKGIIPIYLATVLHGYKKEISISNDNGQISLNVDALVQINERPEKFFLSYIEWDSKKEAYIQELDTIFHHHIYATEKESNTYDYIATAIHRWYLSLPRYVKETKSYQQSSLETVELLKLLRQNHGAQSLLFEKLPKLFNSNNEVDEKLAQQIGITKNSTDKILHHLKYQLIDKVKEIFATPENQQSLTEQSLTAVIQDWCTTLDSGVFTQLFSDGTNRCLSLFMNITNNEEEFVEQLAKISTGFRIEDWNDKTIKIFEEALVTYKTTAQEFKSTPRDNQILSGTYEISVISDSGEAEIKRFEKIDISKRGMLLYNRIVDNLASMGQAISEQEKRQILITILQELCK